MESGLSSPDLIKCFFWCFLISCYGFAAYSFKLKNKKNESALLQQFFSLKIGEALFLFFDIAARRVFVKQKGYRS